MRCWRCSEHLTIPLDRPRLIAILNVTPDSFADGGRHENPARAAEAASRWAAEGADIIDVGGESTRPGAPRVPVEEQLRRVIPAIRAIRTRLHATPISIDTTRAEVARAAIAEGATIINDVSAGLEDSDMLPLAARAGVGVVLMHRAAPPPADSYSDQYPHEPVYPGGVVACVRAFLAGRAQAALDAGVLPDAIVLDPGLGFGKSVAQNLALIDATPELASLGYPILSALSRKSFVGRIALGRNSTPDERLPGTLDLSRRHRAAGASLFRVHDVAAHAAMFARAASDSASSLPA